MYCHAVRGDSWDYRPGPQLQAQWLDVRVDFALPKRTALRIATGFVRYARIKIHETRKQVECDFTLLFLFLHERLHVPLPENRSTSKLTFSARGQTGRWLLKLIAASQGIVDLRDAAGKGSRRIAL